MKNQNGWTVIEVMIVTAAVLAVASVGYLGYIAQHFISKCW